MASKNRVYLGVLVTVIVVMLGVILYRPTMRGIASLISPLATPGSLEDRFEQSDATPTPEPTAPSEDWPTLTPPPSNTFETPEGLPRSKSTPTPTATATLLPVVSLPDIQKGELPEDLWSILYIPRDAELSVMGILVDSQGQRWSDPKLFYDFAPLVSKIGGQGIADLMVSPVGDYISVSVTRFLSNQLWLVDMSTQIPTMISACVDYETCQVFDWSNDGTKMVIRRIPKNDTMPMEFVIYDVLNDKYAVLDVFETTLGYANPPVVDVAFTPDGQRMLWITHNREVEGISEIWLTNIDGQQAEMITYQPDEIISVAWHPEGSSVVYRSLNSDRDGGIWQLSLDKREATPFFTTDTSYYYDQPVWSSDGKLIAVSACEKASLEASISESNCFVLVNDHLGNAIETVASSKGQFYSDVEWSPDGRLLMYTVYENDLETIWIYSLDTGQSYLMSDYSKVASDSLIVDARWFMRLTDIHKETE